MATLYCVFIGDGYLYGATRDPQGAASRYWIGLRLQKETHTIAAISGVPEDVAARLCTDDFGDGYAAAQAAAPFPRTDIETVEYEDEDTTNEGTE